MNIKRNFALATLAAMVGVPTMGIVNTHASETQFHGNTLATSNPFNNHVIEHNNQRSKYKATNSSQKQISEYGSPFKCQQKDTLNQNNSKHLHNKISLPQTGEIDNGAKSIAKSILLSATGTTTAEATTLRKHRGQKKEINIHSKPSNKRNPLNIILQHIKNETNELNRYVTNADNQ